VRYDRLVIKSPSFGRDLQRLILRWFLFSKPSA
jgi:hypothetical protein